MDTNINLLAEGKSLRVIYVESVSDDKKEYSHHYIIEEFVKKDTLGVDIWKIVFDTSEMQNNIMISIKSDHFKQLLCFINSLWSREQLEIVTTKPGTIDDSPEAPIEEPVKKRTFEEDLECLLNTHCLENKSNTPDFILASYLRTCLGVFNVAINKREKWYGREVGAFQSATNSKISENLKTTDKLLDELDKAAKDTFGESTHA